MSNKKLPRFEGSTLHVCDIRVMFVLMCDFYILVQDFQGEFLSVGGQEKYCLVSI